MALRQSGPRSAPVSKGRLLARILGLALALACACPNSAISQSNYPNKPIRLIVPYTAGGGVDIVARTIGGEIGRQTGYNILVENRTGAGSNIGSTLVAKSEPNGYTLLMASNANTVNNSLYLDMQYDASRDLVPIILIGRAPHVLLTSPTGQFKTVRDVIAYAKANPGAINFASGGSGTSEHLAYELFKRRAGIEAHHIPYRGSAAGYPDLISGRVHLLFNNLFQALPFIQSGQLRALGLASAKRSPQLPDVPTLAEQGISNFAAGAWWGIMGPAGIPQDILKKLNQMANAALAAPEVANRLDSLGAERVGGTTEQFRDFFGAELAVWSDIIKAENIKVD